LAKLEKERLKIVKLRLIKESPISFECKSWLHEKVVRPLVSYFEEF